MTILIDAALWRSRGRRWAHLASDTSYEELHEFAAGLGLARRWFQGDHYDVPAEIREQALRRGATPVSSRELLLRLSAAGLRRPRPLRQGPGGRGAVGNPWLDDPHIARGQDYQHRLERRAAASSNPHGEADLITALLDGHASPVVLDAGCGTGRVAIELDRRGLSVVGVDLDPANLAVARRQAPSLEWHHADLSQLALPQRFDAAVAAGNVLLYLTPGTHAAVITALSAHLRPGGLLVAGFQLTRTSISVARYDQLCAAAGLALRQRWGSWHGDPPAGDYQVSVHERRR